MPTNSARSHGQLADEKGLRMLPQTLFFKAATGYAFTIVRAGFAFTITNLPKTSLSPALVAGFLRVLTMQKPGKVNLPVDLTSLEAISARLEMIWPATPC